MTAWWRLVIVCGLLGVTGLLAGCGPKEVRGAKLRGQLVKEGKPVTPQSGERQVAVTFERLEKDGDLVIRSGGLLQKDGTFDIEGQMGKGTPPGKYGVWITAEMVGDAESRFAPLYASGTSPLIADVTADENQFFVVDIGTKTVTKK